MTDVCVCVCVCVCLCVCVRAHVRACVCACVRAPAHEPVKACVNACLLVTCVQVHDVSTDSDTARETSGAACQLSNGNPFRQLPPRPLMQAPPHAPKLPLRHEPNCACTVCRREPFLYTSLSLSLYPHRTSRVVHQCQRSRRSRVEA